MAFMMVSMPLDAAMSLFTLSFPAKTFKRLRHSFTTSLFCKVLTEYFTEKIDIRSGL